jgi:excisionase family DNA binding protein
VNQVPNEQTYFDPNKCAKILGVKAQTIRDWIHSGELRAVDVSKGNCRARWKINPSDFYAFLETKSTKAS